MLNAKQVFKNIDTIKKNHPFRFLKFGSWYGHLENFGM